MAAPTMSNPASSPDDPEQSEDADVATAHVCDPSPHHPAQNAHQPSHGDDGACGRRRQTEHVLGEQRRVGDGGAGGEPEKEAVDGEETDLAGQRRAAPHGWPPVAPGGRWARRWPPAAFRVAGWRMLPAMPRAIPGRAPLPAGASPARNEPNCTPDCLTPMTTPRLPGG